MKKQTKSEALSHEHVERNARSILRKLQSQGAILLPVIGEAGVFGIYNMKAHSRSPRVKISSALVRAFLVRDWLEVVNKGYCLSSAGEAWLKRANAKSEPFQAQNRVLKRQPVEDQIQHSVKFNEVESPLTWLRRRKDRNGKPLIDDAQYKAGEILRRDYASANQTPRVTANWSPVAEASRKRKHGRHSGSSMDICDDVIAARKRIENALTFVGPEMSGILLDVCCHSKGLEEAEKSHGWPQRSGKVVLQIALSRLARHYGLSGCAGNYRADMKQWGSEDYRPGL